MYLIYIYLCVCVKHFYLKKIVKYFISCYAKIVDTEKEKKRK